MRMMILAALLCPAVAHANAAGDLLAKTSAEPYLTACATQRAELTARLNGAAGAAGAVTAYRALIACEGVTSKRSSDEASARTRAADGAQTAKIEADFAARQQARAEESAAIESDPQRTRIAYSALLCAGTDGRKSALTAIERDKKYSKAAGVVRLSDRDDNRQLLEQSDAQLAAARARLKTARLTATSCSDEKVKAILACSSTEEVEGNCAAPAMLAYVSVIDPDRQ